MNQVVRIFNNDGTDNEYELLASRLGRFLSKYDPQRGYRIVIEAEDYLSARPGLMELYKAALSAGMKPDEAGLPPIGTGIVFKASLLDKDGNTILTASALKAVSQYKDWEVGETAARQRLVAAAGFDGSLIKCDEEADMAAQRPDAEQAKEKESNEKESNDSKPETKKPRRGKRGSGKSKVKATEPAPTAQADGSDIPPAMLAQIEHLAKIKGVEAPSPATLDEAKVALKELLAA
jgi:hypothetical protein